MKISLLHNMAAGAGVSVEDLRRELARAGHTLVHASAKDGDIPRVLGATELLVVAGGDGTVARAAVALAGRAIPLAILPLGTANNIALSLGIEGSVADLVAGWTRAIPRPLDLGVARGAWGESQFVEAVGSGLVSRAIAEVEGEPPDPDRDPAARLLHAARRFRDVLARLRPHRATLTLDGARMSGDFLLVEVLNIRSVGPNLVVSEDADPSDGVFHVVTAGEEHRREIDAYLGHKVAGRRSRLALPTRRARQVEIQGCEEMHVDDQIRTRPLVSSISIRIQSGAVQVLPPPPGQVRK